MKRILTAIFIICICISVYAAQSDDKFINALRNCTAYTDSGNVNVQGINARSEKQLSGWQNDRCVYKENINLGGISSNIVCKFSKPQIQEITSVADAYFTTMKYSNTTPDVSSLDAVQNNPVANVFNKYLQDSSVCTISGMQ